MKTALRLIEATTIAGILVLLSYAVGIPGDQEQLSDLIHATLIEQPLGTSVMAYQFIIGSILVFVFGIRRVEYALYLMVPIAAYGVVILTGTRDSFYFTLFTLAIPTIWRIRYLMRRAKLFPPVTD